jgi:hypothetical protein
VMNRKRCTGFIRVSTRFYSNFGKHKRKLEKSEMIIKHVIQNRDE